MHADHRTRPTPHFSFVSNFGVVRPEMAAVRQDRTGVCAGTQVCVCVMVWYVCNSRLAYLCTNSRQYTPGTWVSKGLLMSYSSHQLVSGNCQPAMSLKMWPPIQSWHVSCLCAAPSVAVCSQESYCHFFSDRFIVIATQK